MHDLLRPAMARLLAPPLTLLVLVSGCHKWVEVEPPERILQEQAETDVRDRDELRLHLATSPTPFVGILSDLAADSAVLSADERIVAVPTAEISRVEVRRGDPPGTVALALLGAAAAAVAVVLIHDLSCAGFSC